MNYDYLKKNMIDKIKLINLLLISTLLFSCSGKNKSNLPFIGNHSVNEKGDTVYHTVPEWNFINQDGKNISDKDYKNKIYIADFFFTSCPTICPKMTTQLKRVQSLTKDKNIMIVSYSVDAKRDTVEKLKAYVEKNGIETSNWNLLTGDPETIFDLGMYGYNLSAMEDENAPGGFLHSQMIVLVDKEGHIRGMYDGTSTEEMDKLVRDIDLLTKDYE